MAEPIISAANSRTYSLRTLMLLVTLLAICFRIAREGPVIGLVGVFVFPLAVRRTISDCKLRPGGYPAMTITQMVWAFFESVAVVLGAMLVGLALIVTMSIAAVLLAFGNASWPLQVFGIATVLFMLVLAPAAVFFYLALTWPRSSARRRSVVSGERWYDHQSGLALPIPPWKLGDDNSDDTVISNQSAGVARAPFMAGDAGRA